MPTSTFKLCALCNLKIKDEELASHQFSCRNEIVLCPSGCGEEMQRYLISYHAEFECEKCGYNGQRCKMVDHMKSCIPSNQSVACFYCGQLMTQIESATHVQKCDLCLEDCEKCGVKIQRVYMHFHLKESCANRAIQCEYCSQGLVANQLAHHLEVCELIPIYCGNKCGEEFERKKLTQHMQEECPKRMIECEYCVEENEAHLLDDHHSSCMKFPVGCPETCGVDVLRKDLDVHLDEQCTKRLAKCSYSKMKCSFEGFPAALRCHMQQDLTTHTNLMRETIENLLEVVDKQKQTISTLENKTREANERLQKEEEEKTYLRNRLQENEKKFSHMNQERVKLRGDLKKVQDVVDNIIHENKSFVWKITEFSRKLQIYQAGESVQSRTFYSSKCGYKLILDLYPNGGKDATGYVSLSLSIVCGNYDSLLEWPFKRIVTMKLLAEKGVQPYCHSFVGFYSEGFNKPKVNESQPGWGYPKFISHEELKKYIYDDTVFIEVTVD